MSRVTERHLAFVFGVIFICVLLVLAIAFPTPTPFQYTVFRIVLALAAGGVAAMIPGFLSVTLGTWLRAGGAIAVFVIVYFYSPAGLTGVKVKTAEELEIEKPIITAPTSFNRLELLPQANAQAKALPTLVVNQEQQLSNAQVVAGRYQSITIERVRAVVPADATLVANEISSADGGELVGSEFSILARHLSNITIDVSGNRSAGQLPGSVHLYAKLVENTRVLANGAPGKDGDPGAPGLDGTDGANGRDGDCGPFGAYRGAKPGGNGGDAGQGGVGHPGGDGQDGGLIVLTTIMQPAGSTFDVTGGAPGTGGAGGPPGKPGFHGTGGVGCTGLGGSQPNQPNGQDGRSALPGPAGPPGGKGRPGEFRLQITSSFDPIIKLLDTTPNSQLNSALLQVKLLR